VCDDIFYTDTARSVHGAARVKLANNLGQPSEAIKSKMGRTCSIHGSGDKCLHNFSRII
jgi:hypothetical protein